MNETSQEAPSLLKVHLRIRNTDADYDDIYSVEEDDPYTLVATAPESSETHKNSARNSALAVQKFKFSRIYVPSTTQSELFETTALPMLDDCLNMENNGLLFTYGVTASGKTHTVQGPKNDAGILPRSLDLIFNSIGSNIKPRAKVCPILYNSIGTMSEKEQAERESIKQRILYPPNLSQDINITGISDPNSTRCTAGSLLSECEDGGSYLINDNATVELQNADNIEYSVWVSYIELYNENIYDLLHPPPQTGEVRSKERPTLKLGEDHSYSVYVKRATDVEVCSFAEATRVLAYGQRNRKMASTSVNKRSSRSHAIFKVSIIAKDIASGECRNSQMTFVDLAGSERYSKTNAGGLRLKEAGNINTSLLTLGKCIASLRHNSKSRSNQQIVPFRESKLTRMFKNFLAGDGLITMIVCVNPCPQLFDETIHALKFSAIASETSLVVRPPPARTSEKQHDLIRQEIEFEVRRELTQNFQKLMQEQYLQHQDEVEAAVDRERTYYENQEANIQRFYQNATDKLKAIIRELRDGKSGPGGTEYNELEEQHELLKKENANMKEELNNLKKDFQNTKNDLEQSAFNAKLELRTTQQLFNEEKDRYNKLLSENAELFQANEEVMKTSAFWEKEYNTIKQTHAEKIEDRETTIRQYQIRISQLESELAIKTQTVEELSKENVSLKANNDSVSSLKNQVQTLKSDLLKEKESSASTLNSLNEAKIQVLELEKASKDAQTHATESQAKLSEMIERKAQDSNKIQILEKNYQESGEVISNLKVELKQLQKVLSTNAEDKENRERNDQAKKENIMLQEKLLERDKAMKELQDQLNDIVRNKSLQFDAIISKKDAECDLLTADVEEKENTIANLKKRILELEDLAGVQKSHLTTVETASQDRIKELELENQSFQVKNTDTEKDLSSLRLAHEITKQECDRLKVELQTAHRKHGDAVKKLNLTIEAKDIEIKNWYTEKEKAISLITTKKEKEIAELERQLASIKEDQLNQVKSTPVEEGPGNVAVTESQEYLFLASESTRKLTEMADMVVQLESERDDVTAEFEQFKEEINTAISEKETLFKEMREALKDSQDKVHLLEQEKGDLAKTLDDLKKEQSSRKKNISQLSDEMDPIYEVPGPVQQPTRKSARSTRTSTRSTRVSKTSTKSQESIELHDTSVRSSRRTSGRVSIKTAPRRTSQVLLTKGATTTTAVPRSKRSRVQIKSNLVTEVAVPEQAGLKRKNTLRGLKNFISNVGGSPKRGKKDSVGGEMSESDSDFVTPYKTRQQPTPGRRKLHKSQISSPDLLPPPTDRAVRDVTPEAALTGSQKVTRSRTRLIQQHLSGSGLSRKTRSRNTKI